MASSARSDPAPNTYYNLSVRRINSVKSVVDPQNLSYKWPRAERLIRGVEDEESNDRRPGGFHGARGRRERAKRGSRRQQRTRRDRGDVAEARRERPGHPRRRAGS